jgi:hypothetical protein
MIDTLPLPVCVYTRAPRDRCLSHMLIMVTVLPKRWITIGFKLGLRIARSGMVTNYPLLAARPHDIQFLEELSENFSGTIPADKGFIMVPIQPTWLRETAERWPNSLNNCVRCYGSKL